MKHDETFFNIFLLKKRYLTLNIIFFYKLLHHMIDFELLEQLHFKINPINIRKKYTFYLVNTNFKFMLFIPANILMSARSTNLVYDLFHSIIFFFLFIYIFYFFYVFPIIKKWITYGLLLIK
jgi:hypothetical protein